MTVKQYIEYLKSHAVELGELFKAIGKAQGFFNKAFAIYEYARDTIRYVEVLGTLYTIGGSVKHDIAVEFIYERVPFKIPFLTKKIIGWAVDFAVKFFNNKYGQKWIVGALNIIASLRKFSAKVKESQ
jgi:hypothetical protein